MDFRLSSMVYDKILHSHFVFTMRISLFCRQPVISLMAERERESIGLELALIKMISNNDIPARGHF